ncbi:homologous-pairing protein 2 homolog [Mizuhopecten yessoensis]|uniref:homologous-pairing protein 2 homolog n=1 Tax=Mizuhopecten yessoensis TaxID=6573 RepID=UPI000B45CEF5|nr:homologous-pairing protein 2 homolog [Mizuhopecten yessoensis]
MMIRCYERLMMIRCYERLMMIQCYERLMKIQCYERLMMIWCCERPDDDPAVVKACEGLTEAGKIKEKVYGKQKVYVADQETERLSQFPDVDDVEIKEMDAQLSQLSDLTKVRGDEVRRLDSELKGLNNSISTKEAKTQLVELEKQIYNSRKVFVKEWRKRKRMANDIIGAILEGYPKTRKELYDDVGIETDEDYKVSPPEI